MKSLSGQAVFVEPSGRRRRLARRVVLVLAVPVAGYLVLLVSTMVGGPAPHTPLLPIPDTLRPPASREELPPSRTTPVPSRKGGSPTATPPGGRSVGATSSRTPGTSPTQTPTQSPQTPQTPQQVSTPTARPRPGQANGTPTPGRANSPTARPTRTKHTAGATDATT